MTRTDAPFIQHDLGPNLCLLTKSPDQRHIEARSCEFGSYCVNWSTMQFKRLCLLSGPVSDSKTYDVSHVVTDDGSEDTGILPVPGISLSMSVLVG